MTVEKVAAQLAKIAKTGDDFPFQTRELVDAWKQNGVGVEAVEPILRFMEEHPDIDYGSPGYLVHFVEKFADGTYPSLLSQSILRKPTAHTVWMLNRLVNGARGAEKTRYMRLMEAVKRHPHADALTVQQAERFLEWQTSQG